ncbi:MAG: efflux RND transporter periplasmic adaptor subunit [Chloroflexi bacterium]|nr:efflux RND transporter periplasmic adaptor subunit [Chloroflexota bacterium]
MRRLLVVALIVIVVVGGFFGYQRISSARAASTQPSAIQSVPVTRGTLLATVSSAGNIAPSSILNMAFTGSGQIKTVKVKIGDKVKAGDVLATLDTSDLDLQLQQNNSNLTVAQAQLEQTKKGPTAAQLAVAEASLASAQAAYEDAKQGPTAAEIALAEANVQSAQASYDAAKKSVANRGEQMTVAQNTLKKAEIALQDAQSAYDKVAWRPDIGVMSQSKTLQQATIDYQTAQANYNLTVSQINDTQVIQAQASLTKAKSDLDNLINQSNDTQLKQAAANVAQAQSSLDSLKNTPTPEDMVVALAKVDQARMNVEQTKLQLKKMQLVAPFDGTITAVNIIPGQQSGGSTAPITLAALNDLQIVVNLSEVDQPKVKAGQDVQITLDALPNANLNGKVESIYPAAVIQQGVVNYPVIVKLVNPPLTVISGMTANASIVVDKRENVLLAPNRAIKTQGRTKTVTVMFEGQQITTQVQTGLANDTQTEITSGVKEGDELVLNATTTTSRGVPGAGGFGGGFGGPGFIAR